MSTSDFDSDRSARLAEGFNGVAERTRPPHATVPARAHLFAVRARRLQGELWRAVGEGPRHLMAGDGVERDRDAAHAERYGSLGAGNGAARKHD